MDDDLIIQAAKRILLDGEAPNVLATGFLRGVNFEMNVRQMNFGAQSYQQPGQPMVKLDIMFDCTNDQLKRLREKLGKHIFRVVLIDGDDNG